MPSELQPHQESALTEWLSALVDQQAARPIVRPQENASGYWFGGGNLIESPNGDFYLTGRYRDRGDSRTGLGAGKRGWELALFRSTDRGQTFEKAARFSKSDLQIDDRETLSIEGSALLQTEQGVELFVSTEKTNIRYPASLESYLKPGTGVWTIEHLRADSVEQLPQAERTTILQTQDPRFLHIKDPFVYQNSQGGLVVGFCSHPYCWTSSNTGYCLRAPGSDQFSPPQFDLFPRGYTWDVAISRGTALLDAPQVGVLQEETVRILFYDGGESVRQFPEHAQAVSRPRGYSCEEIGGAAYQCGPELQKIWKRLSLSQPLFVSPWGTGCSRYVNVLETSEGYYAAWQQAREDGSQPLVMNFVDRETTARILQPR